LEINIDEFNSGNNSSGNSRNSQTNSNMAQVPAPELELSILANNLTDENSVGFLDLPYEIQLIIYRYWFSRPIGILPAVTYYTRKLTRREKTETGRRSKRYPANGKAQITGNLTLGSQYDHFYSYL
jgi:hypothetical protein